MGSMSGVELRERVRRLAASGGDLTSMRTGLDRLLRTAIGYDVAAISTVDPATMLWTSCFVSGLPMEGGRDRERIIFDLEFRGADVNGYAWLAQQPVPVGRLHAATEGRPETAARWGPLLEPLGVADEMRVILRGPSACWGTLTLYRRAPAPPFDDRDQAVIADAIGAMSDLFRLALLRHALAVPSGLDRPPGVLIVRGDAIESVTDQAEAWLDAIDDRGRVPSVVQAVASAAAAGNGLARAALPGRDGHWVVMHGSPLSSGDSGDDSDRVSVIVEGARPIVLSDVIAGAYGFTPREREVTALAAQGRTTKQMAVTLGISPFTVQDHLKSVFAKTGSQTRGELVATIYAQQYEPRSDAGCTPSPYGWYLDDGLPAA